MGVTLEKHKVSKTRYDRANQDPYMNKTLSKDFSKGSPLRNKFSKCKGDLDKKAYNKRRSYVVSLLRKG